MKITVTAGCGHTVTVQLYGSSQERERRAAWMRSPTGRCNECYAEYKRAEEAHQHELEVQRHLANYLMILERHPHPEAQLQALRAEVSERMRLAPAIAGREPRVQAALRLFEARGGSTTGEES